MGVYTSLVVHLLKAPKQGMFRGKLMVNCSIRSHRLRIMVSRSVRVYMGISMFLHQSRSLRQAPEVIAG